jgi:hypothetical protein
MTLLVQKENTKTGKLFAKNDFNARARKMAATPRRRQPRTHNAPNWFLSHWITVIYGDKLNMPAICQSIACRVYMNHQSDL